MHSAANSDYLKRSRTTDPEDLERTVKRLLAEDEVEPQDVEEEVAQQAKEVSQWENELRRTAYRMGCKTADQLRVDVDEMSPAMLIDYHSFCCQLDAALSQLKEERAIWKRRERKLVNNINDLTASRCAYNFSE